MSEEIEKKIDSVAEKLRTYAHTVLIVVFGLLPIFFVPSKTAPFDYSKILFVLSGLTVALVLYSLSVLRSGSIRFRLSYAPLGLWVVALFAFLSSVLSGDFADSFIGDSLSIHSSLFVGILALTVSVWMLLDVKRSGIMRLYILLAASTLTLVVYHIVRLLLGPDMLTFDVFFSATASLVGGWNDLALFLGLSVIIALIALEQLPLTKSGRVLFSVVTLCALFMLSIINFFMVWLVLGLTSLSVVIYGLSKDRMNGGQLSFAIGKSINMTSLVMSLVVLAVSTLFIVGGSILGGFVSKHTGVSYIEVRPSLEATANIARNVYAENAFLGIGANKFVDAWRLYKEQTINTTIFWNTDFVAGNGYITTFFVTSGILGGIAWISFIMFFMVAGIRMILTANDADRLWYFIGVSSFVTAAYIWGMSLVYVPGSVILMLGALCTGITLTAERALASGTVRTFSFTTNRRIGFVLTFVVIVIIIGSVTSLYTIGRHYAAAYRFNESILTLQETGSLDEVEALVVAAYGLRPSDTYARRVAELQLARVNNMLQIQSPTAEDQDRFSRTVVDGLNVARQAVDSDATEPTNWAILGNFYSVLQGVNSEGGVYEKGVEALTHARDLNPKNPITYLELAILDVRAGKFDTARTYAEQAVALKSDFTDAFFYLSQIDIATGNVDGAIKSTLAIVGLEPQNPARYYQLGVLYLSKGDLDNAILSLERAVALDQNYANARYFLALIYDTKGRPVDARMQLEKVLALNPGNTEVYGLIETLKGGGRITGTDVQAPESQPVPNPEGGIQVENGTVTTSEAPHTPLVTPVNTAPEPSHEESNTGKGTGD